jgi:hypothetical protein
MYGSLLPPVCPTPQLLLYNYLTVLDIAFVYYAIDILAYSNGSKSL